MKSEQNLKAFIVGSSFFVFIVPILVYFAGAKLSNPATFFLPDNTPTALPAVLGIFNVLYFYIQKFIPVKSINGKYLITGFIYGFIFISIGFLRDIPGGRLMLQPQHIPYIFILAPVTYALVWRYIVKNINHLFRIHE